ncbi:MAG: radical SAM protein [bacterium]|nr:radical SAM protein [bacterium]
MVKEVDKYTIFQSKDGTPIPSGVEFEVTNRCNLNCVHCMNDESADNELSLDEITHIIDQLLKIGIFTITFSGGEPSLRRDFFDIIGYAASKGFSIELLTNGTLITKPVVDRLSSFAFLRVFVSLFSSKPEVHESITQVRGSFNSTLNGLKLLKMANIKTTVNIRVMKQNFATIDELIGLCKELSLPFIVLLEVFPCYSGSTLPLNYRLSDDQIKELTSKDYWSQRYEPSKLKHRGLCGAGYSLFSIGANGKVYPCGILRMEAGDLRKDKLITIWKYSPVFQRVREIRKEAYPCGSCKYFPYCRSCIGESWLQTRDIRKIGVEYCRIMRNDTMVTKLLTRSQENARI